MLHTNVRTCSVALFTPEPQQTCSRQSKQQVVTSKKDMNRMWPDKQGSVTRWCTHTHTHLGRPTKRTICPRSGPCQLTFEVSFLKPGKVFRFHAFLTLLCFALTARGRASCATERPEMSVPCSWAPQKVSARSTEQAVNKSKGTTSGQAQLEQKLY